jgi:hypothetical protein
VEIKDQCQVNSNAWEQEACKAIHAHLHEAYEDEVTRIAG